jgi:para-nitrobenzyl esterase
MRKLIVALAMSAAFFAGHAEAQQTAPAANTPPAANVAAFSTAATPLGQLLDNAGARAVLERHIPAFVSNPQITMARGMTLKGLQAYAPNLTDEVLAAIDADLANLPRN